MGESACLVSSFPNPSDIPREAKEGDPIRALTASVSFGRFMSESLAWEKWSTFSHNPYLEEVEKFSKPGSVAQKKALFEAHYKKRAAMMAAALLEQANTIANNASQMGTINAAPANSSLNTYSANANTSLAMNQQEKDVSDAELANAADVDAGNLNIGRENMDVGNAERGWATMEQNVNMENTQIEISKALENVDNHGIIMATPDKRIPHEECTDQKSLTSSSKKKQTTSLSKSTPSRASKLPLHPSKRLASAQARSDAGVAKSTANSNNKKKTIPNSLYMSINFASKTSKASLRMPKDSTNPLQTPTRALKKAAGQENLAPSSEKRRSNSTLKLSDHGGAKQATSRVGNNHAFIDKRSIVNSNEQRRILPKTLHVSMNFTPPSGENNKTSLIISRESSTLQTPSRASVNGASKHASKVLHSQDKRTRAVLNNSISGWVAGDERWTSLSNCSKSSIASGTSTRSCISSYPCSFRSEERAAKRKGASLTFFKKLEDKMNSKEAEISQTQIGSKDKAKNDLNKLRQSTDGKARPNEDLYHGSHSSCNNVEKIPPTRRKSSPSIVQDAKPRPPRRPSNNTESSKHASVKTNRITCSVTSLPKKRRENASPNIQLSVGKGSISYKREHEGIGLVAGGCGH